MMAHRYSEALRRVAAHIAQNTWGEDVLRACVRHERAADEHDPAGWDVAEAVYYVAGLWHAGQRSPMYAAQCATEFEPSRYWRRPERGSSAAMLAAELHRIIGRAERARVRL
jgi:hypothetical protein